MTSQQSKTTIRRERLEASIRKVKTKICEYHEKLEELNDELQTLRSQLLTYALSSESLELLGRAEQLPETSGVYVIYASGQPIYVGESRDVRARCIGHARGITKAAVVDSDSWYDDVSHLSPNRISFDILENLGEVKRGSDGKFLDTRRDERKELEKHHIQQLGKDNRLFNVAYNPREKRPQL